MKLKREEFASLDERNNRWEYLHDKGIKSLGRSSEARLNLETGVYSMTWLVVYDEDSGKALEPVAVRRSGPPERLPENSGEMTVA